MRTMKGNRCLWALGVTALGLVALAGSALAADAEVSTERSGSVIVFPKVVWDGTRDTIIRISNTGNPMVHALCFYINAAPQNPNLPPSATNPPQWTETDFEIWLTRQQPTHWVASAGRRTVGTDAFGSDGSGLDPGLVPPVQLGFTGELKCVQVADDGSPTPGNKLKGEAVLRRSDGDVSSYNAIALQGNASLTGGQIGNDLALDFTTNHTSGEYSACPDTLLFNHFAYGAPDPVVQALGTCPNVCSNSKTTTCTDDTGCTGGGKCVQGNCPISTTLTLVPCSEDLENQRPSRVNVNFQIFNEFEQPLSTSTTVDCWMNTPLNRINQSGSPQPNNPFNFSVLGSLGAYTRITPSFIPGGASQGGVLGVAEETRIQSTTSAVECRDTPTAPACLNPTIVGANAAFNLHTEGNRFDGATDGKGTGVDANGVNHSVAGVTDHMILPAE